MNDIISLHVGQAGTRIGYQFWKQIQEDNKQQFNHHNANLFQQNSNNHYNRAIFIDSDPRQQFKILNQNNSFNSNNFIHGIQSCRNLFAQGMYGIGNDLYDQIGQVLSKEIQKCDHLCGFIITSGLAGGAGSGITGIILRRIRQHYPSQIVKQYLIAPNIDLNPQSTEVYNSIFALNSSIQQSDLVVTMTNTAIEKQLGLMGNHHPSIDEINKYYGKILAETSATYRLSGELNCSLRKLAMNLVMFPRLKFLAASISNPNYIHHYPSVLHSIFDPNKYSLDNLRYSSNYLMHIHQCNNQAYQGQIYRVAFEQHHRYNIKFVQWLEGNISLSISESIKKPSASLLVNSAGIVNLWNKMGEQFSKCFRRKTFCHHYLQLGMDQMEFTEAESNLNDIVSEYTPQGCMIDDDADFDQ